jgi:hypothetical protein
MPERSPAWSFVVYIPPMSRPGSAHARRVDVSQKARALDTLTEPHYAAAWEVTIAHGDARCAEQWARATFEDAPPALRRFILTGWIAGLRLSLGPRPSADHILGWRIETATPELTIMGVQSALIGTAHFVLVLESSRALLTNFVRYEKPAARPVWSAVQPLHHRIVPYLLGHAASHSQQAS